MSMNIEIYFYGLIGILTLGFITWIVSIFMRDVSIVDSVWSLMFLSGAIVFVVTGETIDDRTLIIMTLVLIWALRLFAHLTWRNWGEPEDCRYQVIREKYEPNFALKSLFIIFVFQAVLAWIVVMPLWPALTTSTPFGVWDIFYYVWLKVLLDWPSSIMDWDILFLIPTTWASAVLYPVLISITLLVFAAVILYRDAHGRTIRVTWVGWLVFIIAGIIVVVSFCTPGPHVTRPDFESYFYWPLFAAGLLLAVGMFIKCLLKSKPIQSKKISNL